MAGHKAIVQELYDSMTAGGDADELIDTYLAPDFVEHAGLPGQEETGPDAPRAALKMMRRAFPDFRMHADELLEDGDKVVARVTMSGTHEGELMGIPPSGNKVEVDSIDILQFRDDKVIAHWGVMDSAALLQQLTGEAPG